MALSRNERRAFARRVLAAVALAAPLVACSFDWSEIDLTVGPLFEYDFDTRFHALRPLYAHDPETATDVVWPLGTVHRESERRWWRAFLVGYGSYEAEGEGDSECGRSSASSFNIFPLWFSGISREGDSYWAAFPLYGTHPHFLMMDDLSFVLFSIYLSYTTPYRPEPDAESRGDAPAPRARSRAVLWPLFSWKESPRSSFGFWPLFGWANRRESFHCYFLWPVFTSASYMDDRDTGGAGASWMLWPLCGGVNRERETQFLFLPPFFSWAQTSGGWRLRTPWPVVDIERLPTRHRTSVWPLVERVEGYSYFATNRVEESTWRFGWKIVENTTLLTERTREDVFSFFPIFSYETRRVTGCANPTASYLRVWPFYERSVVDGCRKERVLDLMPMRHAPAVDRNWAPFWTLWSRRDLPDGRTRHSVLFDFIVWHTGEKKDKTK